MVVSSENTRFCKFSLHEMNYWELVQGKNQAPHVKFYYSVVYGATVFKINGCQFLSSHVQGHLKIIEGQKLYAWICYILMPTVSRLSANVKEYIYIPLNNSTAILGPNVKSRQSKGQGHKKVHIWLKMTPPPHYIRLAMFQDLK